MFSVKPSKFESTPSEPKTTHFTQATPKKITNHTKHLIIAVPIILTIIVALTVSTVLLSSKNKEGFFPPLPDDPDHQDPIDPDPIDPDPIDPYPPGPDDVPHIDRLKMVVRGKWGGRPPKNFTKVLYHPTPLVIISHTVTNFCTTVDECAAIVKSIQGYHVGSLGSPDIGYNFLVGGDGNVYVGRGWDIRNFHQDGSIGIAFIGNYLYDELSERMVEATQLLLEIGVNTKKLSDNYTLVCHNQTYATESPGLNVYKIVKTWSHFKPIRIF